MLERLAAEQSTSATGRPKRGRPRGTLGSGELRAHLRSHELDDGAHAFNFEHGRLVVADAALGASLFLPWLRPIGGTLATSVVNACHRPSSQGPRLHSAAKRHLALIDRHLQLSPLPCMSAVAEATVLSTNRARLSNDTLQLGALVHTCSRLLWTSFLSWVLVQLQSQKTWKGLALIVYTQWDETPTQLNIHDMLGIPATTQRVSSSNKSVAKVVQTELTIGLLIEIDDKSIYVSGDLPCPLLVIEKGNSECYQSAIRKQLKVELLDDLL